MNKILIIIPTKNEEKTIQEIILKLKKLGYNNILIVDDCSSDNTVKIVKNLNVNLIQLPLPLGCWGAISTGFKFALENNFDIVITMDGDGQHNPEDINILLKEFLSQDADLCIGSNPQRYGTLKKVGVKLLKIVSGLNYKDILSGFRVYSKRLFSLLANKNFLILDYQDIGILFIARQNKMKIIEVNVKMNPRKYGKSRIYSNYFAILRYMLYAILWSIFKRW